MTSTATRPAPRVRLGWLGPAIVALGAAVAAVAIWYMMSVRPEAGDVISTFPVDATGRLVVRAEHGGTRNFVELRRSDADGERTVWQSIVPTYAGRPDAPGIAWNDVAVSVRVLRGDRAEIFAVSMRDGSKLGGFKLAPKRGAVTRQHVGPVTLTDHERSYELVEGPGWHHLVAFDLTTGDALWSQDLGPVAVTAGRVGDGLVTIVQGARERRFDMRLGTERSPSS